MRWIGLLGLNVPGFQCCTFITTVSAGPCGAPGIFYFFWAIHVFPHNNSCRYYVKKKKKKKKKQFYAWI